MIEKKEIEETKKISQENADKEIPQAFDDAIEKVKSLPGGFSSFMIMAVAKDKGEAEKKGVCVSCGSMKELASLYNNIPRDISKTAMIIKATEMMDKLLEKDKGDENE